MRVTEPARRKIITLLVAALAVLIVRAAAVQFGASQAVGNGLYAVAIVCLAGCVVVLARAAR